MDTYVDEMTMPANQLGGIFNPEEVTKMKRVLEEVCHQRAIPKHDDDRRKSLAKAIIAANKSKPDTASLLALTLKSIGVSP